jgi:hypothetical protein
MLSIVYQLAVTIDILQRDYWLADLEDGLQQPTERVDIHGLRKVEASLLTLALEDVMSAH